MCQSKADGGRRCASSLRPMNSRRFGPSDAAWLTSHSEADQPAAVLDAYGKEIGSAALNLSLRIMDAEPAITDDIRAVTPDRWRNAGLEHRVKSPASIARKLDKLDREANIAPQLTVAEFYDGLRYTFVAPGIDGFAGSVQGSLTQLAGRGYVLRRMDDMFLPGNSYMGFHAVGGHEVVAFEMQFHTEQSYAIKKKTEACTTRPAR